MSEPITAYGGAQVPINDLAQMLGYTSGFITTITVTYNLIVYVQTIVRDGSGNPLSISQLIPQSGPFQSLWVKDGLQQYIMQLNEHAVKIRVNSKNKIVFLQDVNSIGVAK